MNPIPQHHTNPLIYDLACSPFTLSLLAFEDGS